MPVAEGETEKLNDWRFVICSQLGFTADDAHLLAQRHDIDLHAIVELVSLKGCPPEYAVLILL